MIIDCIAIDDEPLALEVLKKAIQHVDYLELLDTFSSAPDALKFLSEHHVDCIFLDIEMPDLNGLELSSIIQQFAVRPDIVFVTAYSRYAVREHLLQAIDFLLKPYSMEDFQAVALKVKESYELKVQSEKDQAPFFLRIEARQVKLFPQEILYLESMGDYVKVFLEGSSSPLIPLITLKKIKSYLPKYHFLQINRSQIVNLNKIGSFAASNLSIGPKKFNVSSSYREDFERAKKLFLE
ncbi:MAG TPA: LytTR family DNA-binding domain-containing protein [Candidatus Sphingobacterium stercoripullorum]|nr:LytTR family DNA-binding domain-containing protein [Candidatus Sphingobacterium stercoripullorum]